MKKIILSSIAIVSLFASMNGVEKNSGSSQSYGLKSLGKETVDSVRFNGRINLNGTEVTGLVETNGNLDAHEAKIGSLKANGQVNLKSCIIEEGSTINGSLEAEGTEFRGPLSISTQKLTLKKSLVGSLTVRKVVGFDGVQVIDLRNGTKVSGPIEVESGKGEIWISSKSSVSKEITGAKVIKK